MKKLSIITPTFNRKKIILEAFRSLEAQTSKDFEWIIVDNGSDAESLGVQEQIQNNASFPVHLAQNTVRGPCACRALGSALAEAKFVAYLDDDDTLSPEAVQTWIETIDDSGADLVALRGVDHIYSVFGADVVSPCDFTKPDTYFADEIKKYLIPFHVTFARFAYRREFILKVGNWNEKLRYREDCEFLLRFLRLNPKAAIAPGGTYQYNKRQFSDKYIDTPYIRSTIESYALMINEAATTPAASIVTKVLANEARNMWLKASIFSPDLAQQLKSLAEANGVRCHESLAKRKLLRWIKTPFRRSSTLNYLNKKTHELIKKMKQRP